MGEMMLHLGFLIFAFAMIVCSVKVLLVYKKNKNFASILMILAFATGFFLAMFSILQIVEPTLFRNFFLGALLFYNAALLTIVFYIIDLRELLVVPFSITVLIAVQSLVNYEVYDTFRLYLTSSMGLITIIGFMYLALKNKDGKSLSFSIHLIVIVFGGILSPTMQTVAAFLYILGSAIIVSGIFGLFDKVLLYKKQEITWIEQELTTR